MIYKIWVDFWMLILFIFCGLMGVLGIEWMLNKLCYSQQTLLMAVQWSQNVVAFIVPSMLWAACYKRRALREVFFFRRVPWEVFLWLIICETLSVPLAMWIEELCLHAPMPEWIADQSRSVYEMQQAVVAQLLQVSHWWQWVNIVLLMCVVTGVAEEMVFRGALLHLVLPQGGIEGMTSATRFKVAFSIGLLFALFHFDLYGLLSRALIGMWLAYLVLWTRSLWPAVFAHALNNLYALMFYTHQDNAQLGAMLERREVVVVTAVVGLFFVQVLRRRCECHSLVITNDASVPE